MKHYHFVTLEKLQVQIVAVLGAAAVYLGLWRAVLPADPEMPVSFLAAGGPRQLLVFACMVWILAVIGSLGAISARPTGTLLAMLVGAAGVSLKSPGMRNLLWFNSGSIGKLYGLMIVETLLLAAIVLVAVVLIDLARGLLGRARPTWLWRDPMRKLAEQDLIRARQLIPAGRRRSAIDDLDWRHPTFAEQARRLVEVLRPGKNSTKAASALRGRTGMCLAIFWLTGAIVMLLLARSGDRGQVLTAVAGSCALGMLLAHQVSPMPFGVTVWLAPVPLGVAFYALAAANAGGDWTTTPHYALALPVDWITAGGAGAAFGYFVSSRMHEHRVMEKLFPTEPTNPSGEAPQDG